MVAQIFDSPTAVLESRIAKLRRSGEQVWRLGLGEPDFEPPAAAMIAALKAAEQGPTGYTETAGNHSLRSAIAERIAQESELRYGTDEIIVTAGAKQALLEAIASLCGVGDSVLIPSPYWVSFPEQVRLAGGNPVVVIPSDGLRLTARDISRAARQTGARGLILNSPGNPSGIALDYNELEQIAAVCLELDLWVISDEVYSAFVFNGRHHVSIASQPGMRPRTVIVASASKTYGMPGWRVGWAAGPATVIGAMTRLQSHSTSNANNVAQAAAEAALRGSQDDSVIHRDEFERRAGRMFDSVSRMRGLRPTASPEGGFFLWVDMSQLLGLEVGSRTIATADDLADALLQECGVAVTPGTGFGSPLHLRLSFAAPADELDEGLSRMAAILSAGR